jgi:chromosome segregation protein
VSHRLAAPIPLAWRNRLYRPPHAASSGVHSLEDFHTVRLNQIKLSGFKSFVDVTSLQIPGQIVGVVGPNGCGKSNIIDAVRWVLGESKASELRGESMQDVIFNGSSQRKPAGRASVELVFDNAAGRAAGQWSQYTDISVKRVLSRDGTSSYFINNQQVRRRDVHDIFLGTGLGPRAYAIIGQGMISRIIEARPEELRVFLEEAAGVSKYKERRRETENRLQDTRENLTRVEDILRELTRQLEKLEDQAVVAKQFQDLNAQAEEKQLLLWLGRREEAKTERERINTQIEKAQTELESELAKLREAESALETIRAAHYAAGDAVHAAQGQFYEANSEVSRLEAEIRVVVESRNRLNAQSVQLEAQKQHWLGLLAQADTDLETAQAQRAQAEEQLAVSDEKFARAQDALPEAESKLADKTAVVDAARTHAGESDRELRALSAERQTLAQQLQQYAARKERLQAEKSGLTAPDEQKLNVQQTEAKRIGDELDTARAQLDEAQHRLHDLEESRSTTAQAMTAAAAALSQLEAQLATLTRVQEEAQAGNRLKPWLAKHGLDSMQRLWQRLHTEPGWENAVQAALRECISGVEMSDLSRAQGFANDAPPARLAFFSAQVLQGQAAGGALTPLVERIKHNDAGLRSVVSEWLHGCYAADDLNSALAQRAQLKAGERIVTKVGHTVDRVSVRFYAPEGPDDGLLARQQELETTEKRIKAQTLIVDESRNAQLRADAQAAETRQSLVGLRQRVADLTQRLHQTQLEVQALTQRVEEHKSRSQRLEDDLAETVKHASELEERIAQIDARMGDADTQLADRQNALEEARFAQDEARAQLDAAREALRVAEREHQQAQFALQTTGNRIAELERQKQQGGQQQEQIAAQILMIATELSGITDATAQSGLQAALAARTGKEEALARTRTELDDLTAKLRAKDEERLTIERDLQPKRDKITQLQFKEQEYRLNQEQFDTQLAEKSADLAALQAKLADAGKPSALQAEVNRLQREIAALGPVNLAALQELDQSRERKGFLDAQHKDLTEAITTLEDAIRKIDMETRDLLKKTFDDVNHHFGRLFPTLFGGGEAKLVMTGEEILDAGVQVMAQPPGKRNSTIHLLSGGEKALTATALVFAIFQLNPAPFCLLDEVDAPLDDANTERFCKLVMEMSKVTQFLFISHNKIAMEMAQQLVGVTMQEQGVSRLVAVDIAQATTFAEAA